MTDNQQYKIMDCEGNEIVKTFNIDKMYGEDIVLSSNHGLFIREQGLGSKLLCLML